MESVREALDEERPERHRGRGSRRTRHGCLPPRRPV